MKKQHYFVSPFIIEIEKICIKFIFNNLMNLVTKIVCKN